MSLPNEPAKTTSVPPQMPPTPRDFAAPSFSELVPFRSTKINVMKSGLLIPAVATAVVSCVLFIIPFSEYYLKMDVTTAYLLFAIFYAAYAYSGLRKNFLIYLMPCIIIYFELRTPILDLLIYIFRNILPGQTDGVVGFIPTFVGYFFGAGLMEELIKAVPGLIGMSIALQARSMQVRSNQPVSSGFPDWLKVQTPLEGILIGMAAGAAFIFIETLYQYVPDTIEAVTKAGGEGFGIAAGFALMLPRVLNGVVGHMCWGGISGYFIGLAALYPRSIVKLLAVGWLVPAVLHGLWDAASELGPIGMWISAALSLAVFIPSFLKAKQLDTIRLGGAFVPTGSILVGASPMAGAPSAGASEAGAVAWGGLANLFSAVASKASGAAAAMASAPVAPSPAASPAPEAPVVAAPAPTASKAAKAPAAPFALAVGASRFGIVAGQTMDLAVLFPRQGLPQPALAEVTVNPKDEKALGLKNLTSAAWTVTTESGAIVNVGKGRSVKLVANEKIAIGDCIILVQSL